MPFACLLHRKVKKKFFFEELYCKHLNKFTNLFIYFKKCKLYKFHVYFIFNYLLGQIFMNLTSAQEFPVSRG